MFFAYLCQGRGLEEALDQLYSAVEVRLGSNASFGYRFIERERFGASLDALIASLRSDDRQQVVQAAKDITQIVKDADEKVCLTLERLGSLFF